MTSTLATEIPQAPEPAKVLLEAWGRNERMRHIPPVEWIARKIDGDLRRRIEIVCASFERMSASDPHRTGAERALTTICRAMDRVAELAKHGRSNAHPGDLTAQLRDAVHHAVANLNTIDGNLFGRRYPAHMFDRSKAEPLMGALVAAIHALHRAAEILRQSDASLDELLLEGLVTLQTPLRREPIA